MRLWALVIAVILLAASGASFVMSTAFVSHSIAVLPADIVPVVTTGPNCPTGGCVSSIYHNIGGQSGSMQVMVIIYLGSYSENLQSMTGGPPGYCNGSSCDTAVFNPTSGPDQYAPLTINWGDGTQTQIANYWDYPNNAYIMSAYSAPGDGLGEGWAYTNYEFFYHTYSQPGTYIVSAIPQANGPIASATYTAGTQTSTTTTEITTTTTTNAAITLTTSTTTTALPTSNPYTPPQRFPSATVLLLVGALAFTVIGLTGKKPVKK
jgi:hypothetical protein